MGLFVCIDCFFFLVCLLVFLNLAFKTVYTMISFDIISVHQLTLILLYFLRALMALDVLLHKVKGKYMVRNCLINNLRSEETEQTTQSKWYYSHSTYEKLYLEGFIQVLQNSEAGPGPELL